MLYVKPKKYDNLGKLLQKPINILVTNRCNLRCGACSQLCPNMPKDRHWDIPIPQLRENIKILHEANRHVGIFGGEPTIHPQWPEIFELLKSYRWKKFTVFTNAVKTEETEELNRTKNIILRPDFKTHHDGTLVDRSYYATMIAAMDVMTVENGDYWSLAQQHCPMWSGCWSLVYNNKAYICEPAAAFDWMNLGESKWDRYSSGWDLIPGQDPYCRSDLEVATQVNKFCRRCGYCLQGKFPMYQSNRDKTLVSKSNMELGARYQTLWTGNMKMV